MSDGAPILTDIRDGVARRPSGSRSRFALAASPVRAVGAVRQLLLDSFSSSLETQSELEGRAMSAAGVGPEGVAAFLARRKPDFKGI